MDVELAEIVVDSEDARRYMLERMANGKTLSTEISRRVVLEEGQIVALLPSGVSVRSIRDFGAGGVFPAAPASEWQGVELQGETLLKIPVPNTDGWLARKIRNFLGAKPDRICVIENSLARPGDAILRSSPSPLVTYSDDVYHILSAANARATEDTLRFASSLPTFVGAVINCNPAECASKHSSIDLETVSRFATNVEAFFVGAFDGEGYLLWSR